MSDLIPAIAYTRVSTEDQGRYGYSLETQADLCRAYAEQHGLHLIDVQHDNLTGTLLDRPGLAIVREAVRSQRARAVVVHVADRLARNLLHSVLLRDEIVGQGAQIHIVTRGQHEPTPEGNLTYNIEAMFAEYEREKIIERGKRGKEQKARSGKWVGAGNVPYGYTRVGVGRQASLVIDPERSAVVRNIFDWYLGVNGERLGLDLIIDRLNDRGVATPMGGRAWQKVVVSRLLSNEVYAGVLVYKDIRMPAPELAIVTPAMFRAVQEQRQINRERSRRNTKREYLLRGLMTCTCGHRMTGVKRQRGDRKDKFDVVYMCNQIVAPRSARTHKLLLVKAERVEQVVWEHIRGQLTSERLRDGIAELDAAVGVKSSAWSEQLADLDRRIAQTHNAIKVLMQRFGESASDDLRAAADDAIQAADTRLADLRTQRDKVLSNIENEALALARRSDLLSRLDALRLRLDDGQFSTRRLVFEDLSVHVRLVVQPDGTRLLGIRSDLAGEELVPLW